MQTVMRGASLAPATTGTPAPSDNTATARTTNRVRVVMREVSDAPPPTLSAKPVRQSRVVRSWLVVDRGTPDCGRLSGSRVHDLDARDLAGADVDAGLDRIARNDHADEAKVELAVREEVLAPLVEEQV